MEALENSACCWTGLHTNLASKQRLAAAQGCWVSQVLSPSSPLVQIVLFQRRGAELSLCNKEGRKSELQSWEQNSARGRSEHMVQAQMHAQTHHKLHGPAAEPTDSWQAPSPRLLLALCHFSNMTWLRRVYSRSSGDTSSIKTRVSNTNSSRNIQFSKYNSGGC